MLRQNQKALKQLSKNLSLDLDIILPVYNEKESIAFVLKEWHEKLSSEIRFRFIVCEDGSTDGTKDLLLKLKKKYPIILNQKKYRRGYGTAVIDGIKQSSAKYILCIDSDGQCDPKDFKKFWKNKEKAKVLIGWRKNRNDSNQRKIFSWGFKFYFNILYPTKINDPSAPFVLFKKEHIIPHLKHLTYLKEGFWWGFVATCIKNKIEISDIPMRHRKRLNGQTNVYHFKKIPDIAVRNALGLIKLKLN